MEGIIGTVIGTLLGWFLNTMSRYGNVKVYFNKVELEELHFGKSNEEVTKPINTKKDAINDVFNIDQIKIEVEFQNISQQEKRLIRQLYFKYKGKEYFVYENNESTKPTYSIPAGDIKVLTLLLTTKLDKPTFNRNESLYMVYKDLNDKEVIEEYKF